MKSPTPSARRGKRLHFGNRFLSGKTVLIIGPAGTAEDELQGVDPAAFDIVIRINRAIELESLGQGRGANRFNTYIRNQNGNRAGALAGHYTGANLRARGVENLVFLFYRWRELPKLGRKLIFLPFLRHPLDVWFIGPRFLNALADRLHGAKPTAGMAALEWVLGQEFARFHVVGFTFFQTGYVPGYNDDFTSDASAEARLKGLMTRDKTYSHKPDFERAYFRRRVAEERARGKRVILGRHVAEALGKDVPEDG
ncbi:hypothetical protein Ga0609869_001668 [Rhodovulum iodosum]|uniref:Glycosyltransferase family 29 (Sialyltransferase) n=1 Tax=Rhodovulum iodosum TaxID=68291 RepID=A0ABV3XSK1_9RHOB|nr:hypothetical protein [Rhodovulum robiginosum]RSK30636.1 hypothetical protein EJA01_17880 [Rhodovulum robiginosum]